MLIEIDKAITSISEPNRKHRINGYIQYFIHCDLDFIASGNWQSFPVGIKQQTEQKIFNMDQMGECH